MAGKGEAEHERDEDRDHRPDQARPEFDQVLDQWRPARLDLIFLGDLGLAPFRAHGLASPVATAGGGVADVDAMEADAAGSAATGAALRT